MKKRFYALIILAVSGIGRTVYNYTGTDITLDSGEVIKTHDLKKKFGSMWGERPLEDAEITLFLHHTVTSKNATTEDINNIHLGNGWVGASYHVSVEDDGDVNLINLFNKLTWHTKGNNTKGLSLVLVGNYETELVSEDMEKSTRAVVDVLCNQSGLNIVSIKPHKQVRATLCPGKNAVSTFEDLFFDKLNM